MIFAPIPAVVKPAAVESTIPAVALVAADDLDDSWIMDDATADALAAESEDFDRYMTGAYAW